MKKISYLKEKLILTGSYLAIVSILSFLKVPCLFFTIADIPCPGCGMTRALLAAFHLDLATAFTLHPMFWSLPILYLYFLLDNGLFRRKILNQILLYGIGIHNFMMGEKKKGITKIIMAFCFGISGILALIDLIKILTDKYEVNPDKAF